jgi:hypothetical protein
LSPQLIGRGSIRTAPRGNHACDRPMARLAPDSSRNTRRCGSMPSIHARKASRSAWTLARSCSAGRDRFFEDVSRALQRSEDAGAMDAPRGRDLPVVRAGQFLGGPIGLLLDHPMQHRQLDRRLPAAAFVEGRHAARGAGPAAPSGAGC